MRAKPREYVLNLSPGPGKYDIECAITKSGKHISSQFKNSEMAVFNPKSSRRFNDKDFRIIN